MKKFATGYRGKNDGCTTSRLLYCEHQNFVLKERDDEGFKKNRILVAYDDCSHKL